MRDPKPLRDSGVAARSEDPETVAAGAARDDLTKLLERERRARLDAEERIQLLLAAASAGSVEDALRSALDRICTYTGWPVGHAYFVDQSTGDLVPSVWHLEKPEFFESFHNASDERRFRIGVGLPGRVLESGKPAWITDVTFDDNFPRAKAARDIGVRGGFGFPVLVGEEVVAVLEFFSDAPADPDLLLLETMAHIGGQLGRVIERHRILDQLETANKQLAVSERLAALGSLTAGIAHEIRNPLNFVTNFAEVASGLVDELRESLEAAREQLDPGVFANVGEIVDDFQINVKKIQEHGKRADGIVRNMLMHSRGQTSVRQLTDLNAFISNYVRLAYDGLRAGDANFSVLIDEEYDSSIEPINAMTHDLSLVFINIAGNACYAVYEKQKRLGNGFQPAIAVKTANLGHAVEIRIRDNGDGMGDAVKQRVFEPFFTTKPAGAGTGLGLSMSYDIIVQQHSGEIRVESEPGQYAEFIITLPKDPGQKE